MLLMKMKDQGRTINGVDYEEVLHSESDGVQLPDHVTNRLSTMEQVPKGKWSMPQTSNQEIGWHVAVLGNRIRIVPTVRSSRTRARAATRQATQTTTTP